MGTPRRPVFDQADPQSVQHVNQEEWQTHREELLSIRENEPICDSIEQFDSLREKCLVQSGPCWTN
jgi:hypothetical protein